MSSGWKDAAGRPATLDIEFQSDMPRLVASLQLFSPRRSGQLADSWHAGADGVSVNRKGDGLTIRNDLPYARIQDKGGVIPARSARNAAVMHFWHNGSEVFTAHVGPSVIKPQNYVRRAVLNAFDNGDLFKVRWGKHGGQRRV